MDEVKNGHNKSTNGMMDMEATNADMRALVTPSSFCERHRSRDVACHRIRNGLLAASQTDS